MRYLQGLRRLKTLWLGENPIADIPGYRMYVLKCLPQIEKLDNDNVSSEERKQAEHVNLDDFEDT